MNLDRTPFAPLATHLIDLLVALNGTDIPVTLVGGFGLALRRMYAEEQQWQTLIADIPVARATEDFDLLLDLEAVRDHGKMSAFRQKLDELGYEEIEGAKYYQFVKPGTTPSPSGRNVKLDLLAPKPDDSSLYRLDSRRIAPRTPAGGRKVKLHAHVTPEAVASEEAALLVSIEATGSQGQVGSGTVRLPHLYTMSCMKLHALRDEEQGVKAHLGDRSEYVLKHAGDLYTLAALLTSEEYDAIPVLREKYGQTPAALEASRIVQEYFPDTRATGSLRVRQRFAPSEENLQKFLDVLGRAFG